MDPSLMAASLAALDDVGYAVLPGFVGPGAAAALKADSEVSGWPLRL